MNVVEYKILILTSDFTKLKDDVEICFHVQWSTTLKIVVKSLKMISYPTSIVSPGPFYAFNFFQCRDCLENLTSEDSLHTEKIKKIKWL